MSNNLADQFNENGDDLPSDSGTVENAVKNIIKKRGTEAHGRDDSRDIVVNIISFTENVLTLQRAGACGSCVSGSEQTENYIGAKLSEIWPDLKVEFQEPDQPDVKDNSLSKGTVSKGTVFVHNGRTLN